MAEWAGIVVVALIAAFVIRTYVVESFVVPTGSMYPTIKVQDRILVNKLSFDFGNQVRTGDIVVFHEAPADPEKTPILVKRVIGLPGQTLSSGPNGEIFVDGRLLAQPWLTPAAMNDGAGPAICSRPRGSVAAAVADCRGDVLHLPAGEYYMMGDHRGDSDDSRYWGPISRHSIIGRAFVRIWPPSRIHWF